MTSNNASMLALLVAQAEGQGADMVTLKALIEEASGVGAERALAALGLTDEGARRDMDDLRELLRAWRDAKASAWKAAVSLARMRFPLGELTKPEVRAPLISTTGRPPLPWPLVVWGARASSSSVTVAAP